MSQYSFRPELPGSRNVRLSRIPKQQHFCYIDSSVIALDNVSTALPSQIFSDKEIMPNVSSYLQWFQAKIGSYDKQIWETSVEQRILQGLENRPKREGSLHKELIDIDLVRGSTFSKAKPRHGLKSVIINGLKRVIFFPFYYNHWRDHLTKEVVNFCLFHYTIQMLQLILYFMWSNSTEIMMEEITLPIVLSLGLGILHAHIVAPYTVKLRRKKTLANPVNKSKLISKNETNTGLSSRKASLKSPSLLSDGIIPQVHNFLIDSVADVVQTRPENFVSNRPKKKGILFAKSSSVRTNSIHNEDDLSGSDLKKENSVEHDYSETETKDSSSEHENDTVNKVAQEEVGETSNDPSCTEALCNSRKHVKISDGTERSKLKQVIRQTSQPFPSVEEPDEEDLKKFITAKYKNIPDPTPINNVKKEKDKSHWKQGVSGSTKGYKSNKTRRVNTEWVALPPGINSDLIKVNKPTITNLKKLSSIEDIPPEYVCNGKPTLIMDGVGNPDNAVDDSISEQNSPHFKSAPISSDNPELQSIVKMTAGDSKIQQSFSQPHTPLNHYSNKIRHRIDVRKVSSADASPTPSRKNSTCFSTPVGLNREHLNSDHLQTEIKLVANNHSLSTSSQGQGSNLSITDNITKHVAVDNSISSEDISTKLMIDLNEDTITKSHKKREEYKQLFEINAQINPKLEKLAPNSSSSSSRKSSSDVGKHSKVKRRYREDHKSPSLEAYHSKNKNKKEIMQSMSETEYDRMNSDVNSTGNSSSDGDDICPNRIGIIKPDTEEPEEPDVKQEFVSNSHPEVGGTQLGMNENNLSSDEFNRLKKTSESDKMGDINDDPFLLWYKETHTPGLFNGVNESVSCYIWEEDELKKTNLSLLDIGWSIIQAVERHDHDKSYSRFGFSIMIFLCFTPIFFRMYVNWNYLSKIIEMTRHTHILHFLMPSTRNVSSSDNTSIAVHGVMSDYNSSHHHRIYNWSDEIIPLTLTSIIGSEWPIRLIVLFGVLSRVVLYSMTFIMLSVAENSFEQRLLYAKHFCRLTSSRRARKYYLPHFRLNKLANIKCWLSLRSYLKKRGPQRSVESIISSAFYMLLAMLSLVCVNLLQNGNNTFVNKLINWDLTLCSVALGIFMMRFLVLGTQITKKYRNLSVIITEQINLFLAMQTRPHKKEELTLAHNVLRLAESLLKEVEGPFRVCGWSMNPFLYNILKVVILSVFSTVLSETCGFKMKLYKIKINPANW